MAVAYRKAYMRETGKQLNLRVTGRTKLMAAYKERKRHSRGTDKKKSWVLGMFSKKKLT